MTKKTKILVVDDEEIAREYVKMALDKNTYEVIAAASGVDALVILEEHPDIDVILLDVMMPGLNGFEVIKRHQNQSHPGRHKSHYHDRHGSDKRQNNGFQPWGQRLRRKTI